MHYSEFIRQSTYRRYGIFIITLLFALYGIQAYMNNQNIETQMDHVKGDIKTLDDETNYMEKYYTNYLKSDYAPYFAGHENGILYKSERLIRLKHEIKEKEITLPLLDYKKEKVVISTPEESRDYFIEDKLPFLKRKKTDY